MSVRQGQGEPSYANLILVESGGRIDYGEEGLPSLPRLHAPPPRHFIGPLLADWRRRQPWQVIPQHPSDHHPLSLSGIRRSIDRSPLPFGADPILDAAVEGEITTEIDEHPHWCPCGYMKNSSDRRITTQDMRDAILAPTTGGSIAHSMKKGKKKKRPFLLGNTKKTRSHTYGRSTKRPPRPAISISYPDSLGTDLPSTPPPPSLFTSPSDEVVSPDEEPKKKKKKKISFLLPSSSLAQKLRGLQRSVSTSASTSKYSDRPIPLISPRVRHTTIAESTTPSETPTHALVPADASVNGISIAQLPSIPASPSFSSSPRPDRIHLSPPSSLSPFSIPTRSGVRASLEAPTQTRTLRPSYSTSSLLPSGPKEARSRRPTQTAPSEARTGIMLTSRLLWRVDEGHPGVYTAVDSRHRHPIDVWKEWVSSLSEHGQLCSYKGHPDGKKKKPDHTLHLALVLTCVHLHSGHDLAIVLQVRAGRSSSRTLVIRGPTHEVTAEWFRALRTWEPVGSSRPSDPLEWSGELHDQDVVDIRVPEMDLRIRVEIEGDTSVRRLRASVLERVKASVSPSAWDFWADREVWMGWRRGGRFEWCRPRERISTKEGRYSRGFRLELRSVTHTGRIGVRLPIHPREKLDHPAHHHHHPHADHHHSHSASPSTDSTPFPSSPGMTRPEGEWMDGEPSMLEGILVRVESIKKMRKTKEISKRLWCGTRDGLLLWAPVAKMVTGPLACDEEHRALPPQSPGASLALLKCAIGAIDLTKIDHITLVGTRTIEIGLPARELRLLAWDRAGAQAWVDGLSRARAYWSEIARLRQLALSSRAYRGSSEHLWPLCPLLGCRSVLWSGLLYVGNGRSQPRFHRLHALLLGDGSILLMRPTHHGSLRSVRSISLRGTYILSRPHLPGEEAAQHRAVTRYFGDGLVSEAGAEIEGTWGVWRSRAKGWWLRGAKGRSKGEEAVLGGVRGKERRWGERGRMEAMRCLSPEEMLGWAGAAQSVVERCVGKGVRVYGVEEYDDVARGDERGGEGEWEGEIGGALPSPYRRLIKDSGSDEESWLEECL